MLTDIGIKINHLLCCLIILQSCSIICKLLFFNVFLPINNLLLGLALSNSFNSISSDSSNFSLKNVGAILIYLLLLSFSIFKKLFGIETHFSFLVFFRYLILK